MKGRKTVPMPPLQMDRILTKALNTYILPKISEPPSSISSVMQTSNEDITIEPKIPEPPLNRPKTLLNLLTKNRKTQSPASSQLFSEISKDTPEESKAIDIDSQRFPRIIIEDETRRTQEEPKKEIEMILKPLNESEELRSEGEFTHQSDVSNVFHVENEEKPPAEPTPSSEDVKEVSRLDSEKPSAKPESVSESEVISSGTDDPLHSFRTPLDSPKDSLAPDQQTHMKGFSRQGTYFKWRQASSSTLGSADHQLINDIRYPTLSRLKTSKSMRSHHSQPDSIAEKREEALRKEFEEYLQERGDQVSLQVRELFDNFLMGPVYLITELDLSNSSLVDGDIMDICQLVQAVRTLEVVNLADNALTFRFEEEGVEFYRRNQTKMKSLFLSRNPLGNGQLSKVFLHFLLCHVNLLEVGLDGCGITDADLGMLATHFEYLRMLKRISLRNNRITDKGARAILHLLKNSEEIEKVHLGGNRLTSRAWKQLRGYEKKLEFETEVKCCCSVF